MNDKTGPPTADSRLDTAAAAAATLTGCGHDPPAMPNRETDSVLLEVFFIFISSDDLDGSLAPRSELKMDLISVCFSQFSVFHVEKL